MMILNMGKALEYEIIMRFPTGLTVLSFVMLLK